MPVAKSRTASPTLLTRTRSSYNIARFTAKFVRTTRLSSHIHFHVRAVKHAGIYQSKNFIPYLSGLPVMYCLNLQLPSNTSNVQARIAGGNGVQVFKSVRISWKKHLWLQQSFSACTFRVLCVSCRMWHLEWSLQGERRKCECEGSLQGCLPYAGLTIASSSLNITVRWKSWFSLWMYVLMFNLSAFFLSGTFISITVYIYCCFQHQLLKHRLGGEIALTRERHLSSSAVWQLINGGPVRCFHCLTKLWKINNCDVTSYRTFVPASVSSKDFKIKKEIYYFGAFCFETFLREE